MLFFFKVIQCDERTHLHTATSFGRLGRLRMSEAGKRGPSMRHAFEPFARYTLI
jgi:hypothetical protein